MKVAILGVSISVLGVAIILSQHTGGAGTWVALIGVAVSLFACFGKNVP